MLGDGTPLADLSPDALESCKLAFTVMDMDESGSLGQDELETAIRVLGACLRRINAHAGHRGQRLPANLCLGRSS